MTSFKDSDYFRDHRPHGYRTPSPPSASEVELLSPATLSESRVKDSRAHYGSTMVNGKAGAEVGQKRKLGGGMRRYDGEGPRNTIQVGRQGYERRTSLGSLSATSAMDVFATIALATSPIEDNSYHLENLRENPWRHAKTQSLGAASFPQYALESSASYIHPGGGAKTTIHAPQAPASTERGSSITAALPVSNTDDAELLLNVSRAIVLSPTRSHCNTTLSKGPEDNKMVNDRVDAPNQLLSKHDGYTATFGRTGWWSRSPPQNGSRQTPSHDPSNNYLYQLRQAIGDSETGGIPHVSQGTAGEILRDGERASEAPPAARISPSQSHLSEVNPSISQCEDLPLRNISGMLNGGGYGISDMAMKSQNEGQGAKYDPELTDGLCPSLRLRQEVRIGSEASIFGEDLLSYQREGITSRPNYEFNTPYDREPLSISSRRNIDLALKKIEPSQNFLVLRGVKKPTGNSRLRGSDQGLSHRTTMLVEREVPRSTDDSLLGLTHNPTQLRRRYSAPQIFVGETTNNQMHFPEGENGMGNGHLPDPSRPGVPLENVPNPPDHSQSHTSTQANGQAASCAGCQMMPNTIAGSTKDEEASWIRCDGCQQWFHFACAGLTEKEVRGVDKFNCRGCWNSHGPTTYLRKSSRKYVAIDYAGLNEGVVKTPDDNPNHPYVKPLKEKTIQFLPDNFSRVAPEAVTLDYFEKGGGMKEPIVIPGSMNPRQKFIAVNGDQPHTSNRAVEDVVHAWPASDHQWDYVPECDRDKLGMVLPQDLTVRQVAELYGPQEKVEVIDVKSQGEAGSWNMKKWADYYESKNRKYIRNVISLEVSTSKLGSLIQRPEVVRQLDLADSVWPPEQKAKGDFPKVQLYCLMSVADSFTDFHIDFGGSSVFYHILKGKKTFLFIPPKTKHLKKYEQWCQSPAQNQTFLADQTKECYRVDLSAGDTMLIPAGWIHAVWTPEDSLVIGGNFLTRLHYGMQIQVAEIEKNTKVPRKFRHPHFQRILWLTAIKYLKDDPLPAGVEEIFYEGEMYIRNIPSFQEPDAWGASSKSGPENYHARYYSKPELDGLPDLVRYLLRTALIATGDLADGVTADTRQRVARAIPKGHGDFIEVIKRFALWTAWKRGNEYIPHWAYPQARLADGFTKASEKKLSVAAIKRLEREAAAEARRAAPKRRSLRTKVKGEGSPETAEGPDPNKALPNEEACVDDARILHPVSEGERLPTGTTSKSKKRKVSMAGLGDLTTGIAKRASMMKADNNSDLANKTESSKQDPRGAVCESCYGQRIVCQHQAIGLQVNGGSSVFLACGTSSIKGLAGTSNRLVNQMVNSKSALSDTYVFEQAYTEAHDRSKSLPMPPLTPSVSQNVTSSASAEPKIDSASAKRIRSTACDDCRRSKRRCVHDENGIVDPVKVKEVADKRAQFNLKRRQKGGDEATAYPRKKSRVDTESQMTIWNGHSNREGVAPDQEDLLRPARSASNLTQPENNQHNASTAFSLNQCEPKEPVQALSEPVMGVTSIGMEQNASKTEVSHVQDGTRGDKQEIEVAQFTAQDFVGSGTPTQTAVLSKNLSDVSRVVPQPNSAIWGAESCSQAGSRRLSTGNHQVWEQSADDTQEIVKGEETSFGRPPQSTHGNESKEQPDSTGCLETSLPTPSSPLSDIDLSSLASTLCSPSSPPSTSPSQQPATSIRRSSRAKKQVDYYSSAEISQREKGTPTSKEALSKGKTIQASSKSSPVDRARSRSRLSGSIFQKETPRVVSRKSQPTKLGQGGGSDHRPSKDKVSNKGRPGAFTHMKNVVEKKDVDYDMKNITTVRVELMEDENESLRLARELAFGLRSRR